MNLSGTEHQCRIACVVHCVLNCCSADLTLLCCLQISTCHQLLHPQVLQLLVKLFETEHSQLDVMEQVILRGFSAFCYFTSVTLTQFNSFSSHSTVNLEVIKM